MSDGTYGGRRRSQIGRFTYCGQILPILLIRIFFLEFFIGLLQWSVTKSNRYRKVNVVSEISSNRKLLRWPCTY